MSIIAPPEPPRPDELGALIRGARIRQLKRRLAAAAVVALVSGAAIATYSIATGVNRNSSKHGGGAGVGNINNECGVRVAGPRVLASDGRTVYREPVPSGEVNPDRIPSQIRCSGPTVWVLWFNGAGMMHEDYVGARSSDGGRTWRMAFAQSPGVHARYAIGAEPGPWILDGPRAAYFLGMCPACSRGNSFGMVSLSVTKDGGRTFRTYPVPALTGYDTEFEPLHLRVAGTLVTIVGRYLVRKINKPPFEIYRHETVTVPVA
jgi:hypothetical protein